MQKLTTPSQTWEEDKQNSSLNTDGLQHLITFLFLTSKTKSIEKFFSWLTSNKVFWSHTFRTILLQHGYTREQAKERGSFNGTRLYIRAIMKEHICTMPYFERRENELIIFGSSYYMQDCNGDNWHEKESTILDDAQLLSHTVAILEGNDIGMSPGTYLFFDNGTVYSDWKFTQAYSFAQFIANDQSVILDRVKLTFQQAKEILDELEIDTSSMEEPEQPFDLVCDECGSNEILRDAYTAWSPSTQKWEICNQFDQIYCAQCDGRTIKKVAYNEEA